mmetsp:Transcript_19705/g.30758  ORF Transcript_19705/g.30758 Transcript_19705/m.30758 type:complete len:204 (-) Transcript_19705:64-675(-)
MGDDSEACSVDGWIQEALYEYEQIANLCNEQSHLGNSSLAVPPPPSLSSSACDSLCQPFDPKTLETAMKYNQLVDHLSTYSEAIDSVRNTHVRLKSKLLSLSNREDKEATTKSLPNNEPEQKIQIPRRTTSAMQDAFTNHIELSERVTRTIMKSSKADCGVLFGNGMIRTSSSNDHEVNVVALAALRASVSQLKAKFGSNGSS